MIKPRSDSLTHMIAAVEKGFTCLDFECTEKVKRTLHKTDIFCEFTKQLATLSCCKRLQVGAVIIPTDLTNVCSIGYNGPRSGASNDSCRLEQGNCGCIHAEANAISKLHTEKSDLLLITSYSPCEHCAGLIINCKRIGYVIYFGDYRDPKGLQDLRQSGVHCADGRKLLTAYLDVEGASKFRPSLPERDSGGIDATSVMVRSGCIPPDPQEYT